MPGSVLGIEGLVLNKADTGIDNLFARILFVLVQR
jgi:hypothetical protein